jgi:Cu-Zn family superoxide dismutase
MLTSVVVKGIRKSIVVIGLVLITHSILAAESTIKMNLLLAKGHLKPAGTIVAKDTQWGLLLTPHLHGLSPGLHGFHVHENPSCASANGVIGGAAGGHLDPQKTGKHLGPYNDKGHLGDLPALYVNSQGEAKEPVLAPRLKLKDIQNRTLMIHVGGDNYSDKPKKLGGGGARMACGVVPGS